MRHRLILTAAALPFALLALAGCSSSSDAGEASVAPAPIGADAIAPVTIDMMEAAHDLKVGDTVVFNVRKVAGTTVASDAPDVVSVTQAREAEGVIYNPGGKALAPGKAIVTITDENNNKRYIDIQVTE
jgi:hypothetical protein